MNLSDWNAAADVRGTGKRVPRHVADDDVIRYVSGVDPDGEPLTRLEVRGRVAVPRETDEQRELRRAIEGWGRAMRERYECGLPVECGGVCHLRIGHTSGCLCDGDEGGEEQCPA